MRLLLLAPPGAGKGTQAEGLAARYALTDISSGELLREHIAQGTPIGRHVAAALEAGDLVADELVLAVLSVPLVSAALDGGYVLDGFPRTVAQAEMADRLLAPLGQSFQAAVTLDVEHDELIRRLGARRHGRPDDDPVVVRHRIEVYDRLTSPLLAYYDEKGILVRVDGMGTSAEVAARIDDALAHLT